MPRLVLASSSPRRREILSYLPYGFVVQSAEIDETPRAAEPPQQMVLRLSQEKANAVAGAWSGDPGIVVAADTTVVLDGQNIGKPVDAAEAEHILKSLRGRPHHVYTGLTLLAPAEGRSAQRTAPGAAWSLICHTLVHMREYSDDELRAYIASAAPFDKAGGYAIQDEEFYPVRRIEGCYMNVMGLPLCEVICGLRALGVEVSAREPVAHDCVAGRGQPCFAPGYARGNSRV